MRHDYLKAKLHHQLTNKRNQQRECTLNIFTNESEKNGIFKRNDRTKKTAMNQTPQQKALRADMPQKDIDPDYKETVY